MSSPCSEYEEIYALIPDDDLLHLPLVDDPEPTVTTDVPVGDTDPGYEEKPSVKSQLVPYDEVYKENPSVQSQPDPYEDVYDEIPFSQFQEAVHAPTPKLQSPTSSPTSQATDEEDDQETPKKHLCRYDGTRVQHSQSLSSLGQGSDDDSNM
jgi:hypothetical protein